VCTTYSLSVEEVRRYSIMGAILDVRPNIWQNVIGYWSAQFSSWELQLAAIMDNPKYLQMNSRFN